MNAPANPSEATKRLNPHLYAPAASRNDFDGGNAPGVPASEADLHNEIIAHCKTHGWVYFHSNMSKPTRATVGMPDFTILADNGRVFFIEVKKQNGKLTLEQEGLRRMAYKLGHFIHTVRSFDVFLELVREHVPVNH
jgi:hypothetical protein